MEKIELPFNVTKMGKKEAQEFIRKINEGEVEVLLEVRDENKTLKGFQTILPFGKWLELVEAQWKYLALLNKKLENIDSSLKNVTKQQISAVMGNMQENKKIKTFKMENPKDMKSEIQKLNPYIEGDTALDYATMETTYACPSGYIKSGSGSNTKCYKTTEDSVPANTKVNYSFYA